MAVLSPGFADAPREAQTVFRAVMEALARPTSLQPLAADLDPPAPLSAELAAVALTLCDGDSPVWLDAKLAAAPAVAVWLRFHTGAPITDDPGQASFALAADPAGLPPLADFAQGTEEFPDRSTTIVLAAQSFGGADGIRVSGPGMRGVETLAVEPLPRDLTRQWRENRRGFPRGVDLVFAGKGSVAGLPRSSRIVEE